MSNEQAKSNQQFSSEKARRAARHPQRPGENWLFGFIRVAEL
jgi:hypothetical protein